MLLMAAVAATVATTPASAQSYLVTVRVLDGTLYTVVVDLPPGATLADVVGLPGVPGTPVAMQPMADPPPPPPPPPPPRFYDRFQSAPTVSRACNSPTGPIER
jgi:hypothetical protein